MQQHRIATWKSKMTACYGITLHHHTTMAQHQPSCSLAQRDAVRRQCTLGGRRQQRTPESRCVPARCSIMSEQELPQTDVFKTQDGLVKQVAEEEAEVDFMGESTQGDLRLHFVEQVKSSGLVNVLGCRHLEDIVDAPMEDIKQHQRRLLQSMIGAAGSANSEAVSPQYPHGMPHRAIFCNRTLNLRAVQAIGYDMDYTLIHYSVEHWEGKAYKYGLQYLQQIGCPTDGLVFDASLVTRGLIVDQDLGNLVKVDRFGYIKRAMHGTRMLSTSEIREIYGRELVNLHSTRWNFLNTLFSVSEAVMYAQMVERMDQGSLPAEVVPQQNYNALYTLVQRALFRTHVEGKLKSEIIQAPEEYVELDEDMARTLLDQKQAGKVLLLITNSDYEYTDRMMTFAYNRFLPQGMRWRDLFDMVIVQARKPDFFQHQMSLYEIVTEDGLMRPAMVAQKGGLYCGGSARMVEKALEIEGDDILYVGDHIYTDAALAKLKFRWRTCLIVRELEDEITALAAGRPHRNKLKELMNKKEMVGDLFNQLRLSRQRLVHGGMPLATMDDEEGVNSTLAQLLMVMEHLDELIGPMLQADGQVFSARWGYLSRAGLNDKSQFSRQIEKYADIYTSRVSNFLRYTPFQYFRSPSQSLAHDRHLSEYYQRKYGMPVSEAQVHAGNISTPGREERPRLLQAVGSGSASDHDSLDS